MKSFCKFTIPTLVMLAITLTNFAVAQTPGPLPKNLVAGVTGPVGSSNNWSGYSALNLISGASQFGVASPNTTLYVGFTGGSTADISNMVIYKTARGSSKITSVTPVKLGGVSNPSIQLSSTAVCPVQPVSTANPCIIRLDPTVLALSPLSDYYFVAFFTSDTNNQTVAAAVPSFSKSSLLGWFILADESHLTVGQSIPAGIGNNGPDFLMYVMSS